MVQDKVITIHNIEWKWYLYFLQDLDGRNPVVKGSVGSVASKIPRGNEMMKDEELGYKFSLQTQYG